MEESHFLDSIYCAFPAFEREEALRIAALGCSISANATFGVVDELTRPPFGTQVDSGIAREVLDLVDHRLDHPLVHPVLAAARRLVRREQLTVEESVTTMRLVALHPGQYAALGVVYFACDDIDGIADAEMNRILVEWDA
ncbi:hypothetical protein [Arenimonas sp.]|uniref:hypothetical protein n=1 Tax=Arenimonas sp. TaxID=1872635 RepID=UPI0039E60879